ncbi:MAG: 2-phospho-L-lactate guanylyltransferase [Candidatus Hydrogenedentota bacterium]|nr:MAG: 2-phospho-L-lactate guanylyltransferase [Candidatus Hydrogenedentota bacterium]
MNSSRHNRSSCAVVVPAKEPSDSKTRLAPLLSPERRRELALLLLQETLRRIRSVSGVDLIVITNGPTVENIASSLGATVLREKTARGESAAVEEATRYVVENGYSRQIVVPGDLASLDPEELSRLVSFPLAPPAVLLSPAVDDDGTNAVVTAPPDILHFRFGERSFAGYRTQCSVRGIPCAVVRLRSFVLDIDTPRDLEQFLIKHPEHPAARAAAEWFHETPSP